MEIRRDKTGRIPNVNDRIAFGCDSPRYLVIEPILGFTKGGNPRVRSRAIRNNWTWGNFRRTEGVLGDFIIITEST